jgi:hypothetical protein
VIRVIRVIRVFRKAVAVVVGVLRTSVAVVRAAVAMP